MIQDGQRSGNGRERTRSKSSENFFFRRPFLAGFRFDIRCFMKRLRFLVSLVGGWIGATIASTSRAVAKLGAHGQRLTWAEFVAAEVERDGGRRYEHWIQMRVCNGDFGRQPGAPRTRRASCEKICGLCRHIYTLPIWPDPNYRRPPEAVLDALEAQEYCPLSSSEGRRTLGRMSLRVERKDAPPV